MIETTNLDNIIVGRIDPHIYAFRTNTVPDYLKVGDTYRPVWVRLNEWKEVFPDLIHKEEWKWLAKTENEKYFRDFAIHYYLEEIKHLHRLQPGDIQNLPYYSREFFQNAKPEDIDEAILDIERKAKLVEGPYHFYSEDRLPIVEHYERTAKYPLRPNQEKTVESFKEARANGRRNLLMYAVMRFGKSFTSMCCATEMEAKTVLIVSAKADVRNEWKRTVESHVRFAEYSFIDSQTLLNDTKALTNLLQGGKRAAIFLTLQDLMGDDLKEKHRDIFRNQIDLLIVDETHFGARAEEYGKVLREAELSKSQIKKELSQLDDTLDDLESGLDAIKRLRVDTTIHLSGTPYRILMGSEFKPEDIIAFYQFTDIIDDKEEWDREHLIDEDTKEWDNPYYGFPQMVRFAFNPNESSRKMLEQMKEQGKTASLTELFRPVSISKDTSSANGHLYFAHEKEVLDLLQVIDGSKEDENILGFLDYQKIKEGSMCRHIVCVLPFCASCDAFEKLIKKYKQKFKNLSEYEIVNISGLVGNVYSNPDQIKQRVAEIESHGGKSITLTVNRMLTGSTVREWDTMLFLKDVSSPQEYDQAIYRLQNQYIKNYVDDNGDTIKYNMKPQTLLVDFDPDRMFVMQEQKSKIYNVNTEERGNEELEERIRKELKISPIIVINKGKISEVVPTDVMDAVRQYSASRTVMDEARDIPTDFNLLQDPRIQLLIEGLEPINAQKGLNIKPVEGDGDELQGDDEEGNESSGNNNDNSKPGSSDTPKDEKDDSSERLATYFAQILFFSMLTDDEVDSLNDIIQVIRRDTNNMRIARNVGLKASSLSYFYRGLNPFILQDLDYKIKNINELVRDTSLEPLNRVERALQKFGRLSISEIVTPSHVADDVVTLLPKEEINEETRFLDIASKQAEFACAIYRRFGEKVRNNIVSLPTSSLTYEFTRKVYSLLEMPFNNIISTFNSYDLIGENKEICKNILKNMKFSVIVGNPPYQENDGGHGSSSRPLYNKFVDLSRFLNPNYITMIMPARWYAGGKGGDLLDFRFSMAKDPHLQQIDDFRTASECFDNVEIKGGVCYFLWNKNYNAKQCRFNSHKNGFIESSEIRDLILDGTETIIRFNEAITILQKVQKKNFTSFSTIVNSRKPFGLPSNFRNYSKVKDKEHRIEIFAQKDKGYASETVILRNKEWKDLYKVYIPEAIGKGDMTSDILKPLLGLPNTICSETYILIGPFQAQKEAENVMKYIHTKFFHFMLGLKKNSQHTTQKEYVFVPLFDFKSNSQINWEVKTYEEIDKQLFDYYCLTENEKDFIKKTIPNL